jgi:hypothetical protein
MNKYVIGDGVELVDTVPSSLSVAIAQLKDVLEEEASDGDVGIVYQLVPVKRFRLVKANKAYEIPLKKTRK